MKLQDIKGLGVKSIEKLAHLNILTSDDLLLHLPFRYLDKTKFSDLDDVKSSDEVLLRLKIERTEISGSIGKLILSCYLSDENDNKIIWRFFHFSQFQRQQFVRGYLVDCFGEIKITRFGKEIIHPEYRIISSNQPTLLQQNLTPIYHLSDGIKQKNMQSWIATALQDFNQNNSASKFKEMVNLLHNPPKDENLEDILNFQHPAQIELIIQELASRKLALLQARKNIRQQNTQPLKKTGILLDKLKLDFELTNSQKKVIKEIENDLKSVKPMLRLLQGDVGCGKTIVAIIASLIAIENGKQVAIMSPTAILSRQHQLSFAQLLQPLGLKIAILLGSQNAGEKRENLDLIKNGADVVIGTQSLFQDGVEFADLGLVIVDEQHKFGVEQRLKLSQKAKKTPHTLAMSATPIPRSIMMSMYGEMDISIIDELPKNRQKVETIVLNDAKKPQILEKIKQICSLGQQVYWVCVLIEESENFNATPSVVSFEFLQQNLPNFNIGLVHSKIEKQEKQQIMSDFSAGKIDVLVATTVIEVGVNVPNASLMVVENAEKLGLASLHQLRGRIGRGEFPSLCILMYSGKLSANARARLDILRSTSDGFKIAKKDLELRGVGEVLGVNQSGIASFKIANLVRDEYLLDRANDLAKEYFCKDEKKQNALISRWVSDKTLGFIKS